MASNVTQKAEERRKNRQRRERWNKLVTGMAAVVVFCTTYALILPAITLERKPTCGIEEHVHDDGCYGPPMVLSCGAGSKTAVLHSHNEFCYDTEGRLICTLPELQEHVHSDSCYRLVTPEPPHVHTDECWKETKTLTCTLAEGEGHTHDETCLGERSNLICTLEETEGHAHTDECRDAEGNPVCGREESQGHTHGPGCYETQMVHTCGQEESEPHTHTESCYTVTRELICGLEEATAEELADPPQPELVLTCGKLEAVLHAHGEGCYNENGNLICTLPEIVEHVHTQDCLSPDLNAEKVLTCGKEAHTHDELLCYIDPEVDLETPAFWEATLPELSGENWAEDLLAVAQSQLGYEESTVNVTVTPEGEILGYTRYGQWAGQLYGRWDEHFVNFCGHYAGLPADAFPRHEGQALWSEELKEDNFGIWFTPDACTPAPGDLVCLDLDLDGSFDRVGIVEALVPATEEEGAKLGVIEGDSENGVRQTVYPMDAPEILGYASAAKAEARWKELHPALPPEPEYYCGQEAHTHGESCMDEFGNSVCGTAEHVHTEQCLTPPPIYYCGSEEHVHEDACYNNEGALVCEKNEHTHTELCLVEQRYYCGQEEHTHGDTCVGAEGELVCRIPEHIHSEDCMMKKAYRCGLEEHIHSESCKNAEGELTCTLEAHTHTKACVIYYICNKAEHVHTAECTDANGELICEIHEHTHVDACGIYWQVLVGQQAEPGVMLMKAARLVDTAELTASGELPGGSSLSFGKKMVAADFTAGLNAGDFACGFKNIQIKDSAGQLVDLTSNPVQMQITGVALDPAMSYTAYIWNETAAAEDPSEDGRAASNLIPLETKVNYKAGTVDFQLTENDKTVLLGAEADTAELKCPTGCDLDEYLLPENWWACDGTNPFGGAQEFNLFLLGDMHNWGVVHGNAAISGNITGTSNSISYDEGSSHNYASDITEHYPIGLILGGEQNAISTDNTPKSITVRNGTVIAQSAQQSKIQMDINLDTDHRHPATADQLTKYFAEAEGTTEESYAGSLVERNKDTFDFCTDPDRLPPEHLGEVEWLSSTDHFGENNINIGAGNTIEDIANDESRAPASCDLVLTGDDPFYNVFNVKASLLKEKSDGSGAGNERAVYLNVPFGSYTIINVINDTGEDQATIDKFSPQLWYQDSDNKWIDQPAKHNMENYTQTQRTLMNFDPSIAQIDIATQGQYIYASILAPETKLHVPDGTDINLHGTIVLGGLECEKAGNPSAIIENPFSAGSKLHLKKDVVCDSNNAENHEHPDCPIEADTGLSKWVGYYADVNLVSLEGQTRATIDSTITGLPMDGTAMTLDGLAPGKYRVSWERVYRKIGDQTIEIEDGTGYCYILVDHDSDPETPEQKQYYDLDGDGSTPDADPNLGGHAFSHASFGTWQGDVNHDLGEMILVVQSGIEKPVLITNHYETEPTTQYAVQKVWMEHGSIMVDGVAKEDDWVIEAPENSSVTVTLYQYLDSAPNELTPMGTFKLSADCEWYHSWVGLPKYKENADGTQGEAYKYLVKETGQWPGYDHDGDEDVDEDLDDDGIRDDDMAIVKNWKLPPQPKALTVDKVWFKPDGDILTDAAELAKLSVNVGLFQRIGTLKPKTGDLHTITVKLGDQVIGEPYPYFPGSQVKLTLNYVHKGQGVENGVNQPTLSVSDGKTEYSFEKYKVNANGTLDQQHVTHAESTVDLKYPSGNVVLTIQEGDPAYEIIGTDPGGAWTTITYSDPRLIYTETPTDRNIAWGPFTRMKDRPVVPLNSGNGWKHTWTGLESTDATGTYFYQYFAFEQVPEGYKQTYVVDGVEYPDITEDATGGVSGKTEGYITIYNKPIVGGLILPMTGGVGTTPYTLGGLLIMTAAVILMQLNPKKRRKEGNAS